MVTSVTCRPEGVIPAAYRGWGMALLGLPPVGLTCRVTYLVGYLCGRSDIARRIFPAAGMTGHLLKLSLSDSSHLTAEALAGKLEPILLNFNTHKDCSWHVR